MAIAPTPSIRAAVSPPAPEPVAPPATGAPSAAPAIATSSAAPAPHRRASAAYGVIDVGSRPVWSRVRIDGKGVGETPIMGLRVPAGSHTVEAVPQGTGAPIKRVVVVSADGHARVVFDVP
jgi:hypothetical protein